MAVTPAQILAVATTLQAVPGEAAQRRAVATAYFAAFLHCRALAGVRRRSSAEHREVVAFLLARDAEAALWLEWLRSARNAADYDIDGDFTTDAREAIAAASRLLAAR